MNRSTRTLIVVGVAVALASLASFGVYRSIQNLPVKEVPVAARDVVVAAKSVPVGAILTPELVRVVGWPASAPVAGGFAKPDDVVGRGVIAQLVENEPITEVKLAPKEAGGGLSPTITPGMRAMSVKVNVVTSVSHHVAPGSHVDIIVTVRGDRDTMSRTVISNAQVLAVGPELDTQKAREGKTIPANEVTMLVTPQDAERLALATTQGQITLVLRNPLDTTPTQTTGVRMASLIGSPDPPPVRKVVQGQARVVPTTPPPPPKPPTVDVYRGAVKTQEVIKK